MSGLAGLLAGHDAPGVWRWTSALEVDHVREAVEGAGWRFAYVDGWRESTKLEVLDALAASMDFPPYFGRNLDALVDCLREVEGRCVLLWDGWGTLANEDRRAFDAIVEILNERAQTEPALAVLLRGAGPETAVSEVD